MEIKTAVKGYDLPDPRVNVHAQYSSAEKSFDDLLAPKYVPLALT
jgi:hypothetical protein